MSELCGVWDLIEQSNEEAGARRVWTTPTSRGRFIFTADGHASVAMNRKAPFRFDDPELAADRAADPARNPSFFYFGRYRVSTDAAGAARVHITVQGSSDPDFIDTELVRSFTISGTELELWNNYRAIPGVRDAGLATYRWRRISA